MVQTFSVAEELQAHTLADSIMALHGTENEVMDERDLAILDRFSRRRDTATRDKILREHDTQPSSDGRSWSGSLALMLVARYGTAREALTEAEWTRLAQWFGNSCR